MNEILIFLLYFGFLLFIDFTWIKLFMQKKYEKSLRQYLFKEYSIKVVLFTYLIMALSFFIFINKFLLYESLQNALLLGGFLGFSLYFVFAFTNYSILKIWNLKLAVLDTVWGTILGLISTLFLSYLL